ncbi:MAG: hypothetical protein ABIJ16_08580 [Bacteroidota bacterium]
MRRPIKYLIITILVSLTFIANAQEEKHDRDFRARLYEAYDYYKLGYYHLALPLYEELYKTDSLDCEINFRLGVCRFMVLRDKTSLIPLFEYTKNDYIDAYFYLGRLYHLKVNLDQAVDYFLYYKNAELDRTYSNREVDYYIDQIMSAKKLIMHPENLLISNLGEIINSSEPEYVPMITSDESHLYYTARREGSTGGMLDPYNEYFEDIYVSEKKQNGWSVPKNIGPPVNSETHDACVALSSDGFRMLIYRTSEDLTGGDIYETVQTGGKWSEPVRLTSEVNSDEWLETSACYTPDENTIYFSSNRPGGLGGKDLYRITRMPDGAWSKAKNLGSVINTQYDDDAPFIHPDGQTMYFSSRGHNSMGGYDIFKCTMMDNGWSAPENMGYPVNTVGDDIYFVMSADGKHGYFSSDRMWGMGSTDLYLVDMSGTEKNYLVLQGTVTTNQPVYQKLPATITVIDNITKELVGIYRTNEKTGKYTLVLLPRKFYKLFIEADGYHSYTDEIDLRDKLKMGDLFKNINMKKIQEIPVDTLNNE